VDGSEAMFTTMCALLAAGFESNVSADNWTAFRAQDARALTDTSRARRSKRCGSFNNRQHELREVPGRRFHAICGFGLGVRDPRPGSKQSCGGMSCRPK